MNEDDDDDKMLTLGSDDSDSEDEDTDENTPIADIILKDNTSDAASDVHKIDHAYQLNSNIHNLACTLHKNKDDDPKNSEQCLHNIKLY